MWASQSWEVGIVIIIPIFMDEENLAHRDLVPKSS